MAKVRVGDTEAARFINFMDTEMQVAQDEVYYPLMGLYNEFEDAYAGEVEPRSADWLSNFPIQMGATFTDAVTARIVNTIEAFKPTWSLQPTRDAGWAKVARKTEQFMDFKVQTEMNYYPELRKSAFDMTRLGMGALLTPWVTERETVTQKYAWATRTTEVVTRNWIKCKHLPIRDFMYPGGYSELEDLPWWLRKLRWTPIMLTTKDFKDKYDYPTEVARYVTTIEESEREAQEREGTTPGQIQRVHAREIYIKWDFKKKGELQRYIVTYHPDSRKIMAVYEDDYPEWPIRLLRYGPRSAELHGLGIVEQTKPFDDALYALYNLLVDNFKAATMVILKGRKGAGLRADTKVYPLKLFLLADPTNDLQTMPLGAPYTLNPQFIRMIWELGERRSGISDYSLGRESAATSRATATGTLALIQEGQRRFDLTIADARRVLGGLGMFTLRMAHDRLPKEAPYMIMGEDGEWVRQFLEQPRTSPYLALNVISNLSNVAQNKEVRKQDAIATFQLLGQYYREMVQLGMLLANPQLQGPTRESVIRIAQAASLKVRNVLEAHGEMAPEQYTDVMTPFTGGGAPQGMQGMENMMGPQQQILPFGEGLVQ